MPNENFYTEMLRKSSDVELLEWVRDELGDAIDGADESRAHDQWLSEMVHRLDVVIERQRETPKRASQGPHMTAVDNPLGDV